MKNLILRQNCRKCSFDIWSCRNSTLFGRCLIAKSLRISLLVNTISNLNISKAYIQAVNSAIFKFIWKQKKDKIKRRVMISDYDNGDLRARPSIDTMAKSLTLAWILLFHRFGLFNCIKCKICKISTRIIFCLRTGKFKVQIFVES